MAQEFYKNAQVLHEEFQRRELQFLNEEKKWNSMILKKDLNLPLQEYLQKIDKREKETEESYRNIMKQMEDLEKRTDMMSFKLEKLRILRNNAKTVDLSTWSFNPAGLDSFTTTAPGTFGNIGLISYQNQNFVSATTQTDNKIQCEICNSEIVTNNKQQNCTDIPAYLPSITNSPYYTNDNSKARYLSNPTVSSTPREEEQNISQQSAEFTKYNEQSFISPVVSKIIQDKSNTNKPITNTKLIDQDKTEVLPKTNIPNRKGISEQISSNMIVTTAVETMDIRNCVDITKMSSSVSKSSLKRKDKIRNVDVVDSVDVSKSDEGSVYHEFDFLEAETPTVLKELTAEDLDVSVKNPEQNIDDKTSLPKPKDEDVSVHEKSKVDVMDNKSDTSGSVTGPTSIHSEILSVGSDSDSLHEAETAFKASAAYQVLLGNTVIPPKSKNKQISDSDSEDEIERALATAVRKGSQPLPKGLLQPKKEEKPSPLEVDSKPPMKPKPIVGNKPQSKLSKNTRKVLGLDTSSGSEVELAVKPPGKKIEEDSDEFDFFD